jgi:hypothetical protein
MNGCLRGVVYACSAICCFSCLNFMILAIVLSFMLYQRRQARKVEVA